MNEKSRLLLYVFVASNDRAGEINHCYATDETDARAVLHLWMAEQIMLGRGYIEVKHWPGGFMAGASTWWPGSIPAPQIAGSEAGYAASE